MPSDSTDVVAEAREFISLVGNCGLYPDKAQRVIEALCNEVERLRIATSHAIRRNHDYAPASCDGCADAEKVLTTRNPHA